MTIAIAAGLVVCASVVVTAQVQGARSQEPGAKSQGPGATSQETGSATVIACNPKAIGAAEKPRYGALTKRLRAAARGMQELPDGYAIRLDGKSISLPETAEWMALERLCCPFLKFELATSGNQSEWTLKLTGPAGTKAILEAEFK